jgi:predicted DNA-binding transcriptional regulator YafY
VARSISSTRDRHQARVLVRAPLSQLRGRVPRWAGTLEKRDERSCVLHTSSDWLGGLAVYVAELGVDFEVLEPPEFAEHVRALGERFARAAQGATQR